MKKETLKKVGKIVGNVLFGIFLVFILFIAIVNVNAKKKNGLPNLFGTGYLTVLTDSMDGNQKDSFKSGDLVIVDVINDKNRTQKALNLPVGTIVTYYDYDEEKVISHRIIEVESTSDVLSTYVVKGDSPYAVAQTRVTSGQLLGVYKTHIKGLGKVFDWLGHGVGFFIIVVLPCILFLLYELYRFIRILIEYNKDKNAASTRDTQIAERKKVLAGLVNDGVITQEQADQQLQTFIATLPPVEDEENPEDGSKEESKEEAPADEPVEEEQAKEEVPEEENSEDTSKPEETSEEENKE